MSLVLFAPPMNTGSTFLRELLNRHPESYCFTHQYLIRDYPYLFYSHHQLLRFDRIYEFLEIPSGDHKVNVFYGHIFVNDILWLLWERPIEFVPLFTIRHPFMMLRTAIRRLYIRKRDTWNNIIKNHINHSIFWLIPLICYYLKKHNDAICVPTDLVKRKSKQERLNYISDVFNHLNLPLKGENCIEMAKEWQIHKPSQTQCDKDLNEEEIGIIMSWIYDSNILTELENVGINYKQVDISSLKEDQDNV